MPSLHPQPATLIALTLPPPRPLPPNPPPPRPPPPPPLARTRLSTILHALLLRPPRHRPPLLRLPRPPGRVRPPSPHNLAGGGSPRHHPRLVHQSQNHRP